MIIGIPGFQEKTASQFIDNLANFKAFLEKHSYLKYYVSKASTSSDISPQNQKFKDKNIVMTGGKDPEIIQFVLSHGGKFQSNINSKTHLLIIKDETIKNNKTQGAQRLNIDILTIEKFKSEYMNYP